MRHRLGAPLRDDRRLAQAHAEPGPAVQQDHVDEEHHAGCELLIVVRVDHRLVHPRRRIGRAERVAAGVQKVPLVSRSCEDPCVGREDIPHGPAGTQSGLAFLQRFAAGLEHGRVTPVRPARQHHVHERRVVMAIGCGELERDLIARPHLPVAGVIADEQRFLSASHGPAAGGWVAVPAREYPTHHLGVDPAHGLAGHGQPVRHRQCLVGQPARLPDIA